MFTLQNEIRKVYKENRVRSVMASNRETFGWTMAAVTFSSVFEYTFRYKFENLFRDKFENSFEYKFRHSLGYRFEYAFKNSFKDSFKDSFKCESGDLFGYVFEREFENSFKDSFRKAFRHAFRYKFENSFKDSFKYAFKNSFKDSFRKAFRHAIGYGPPIRIFYGALCGIFSIICNTVYEKSRGFTNQPSHSVSQRASKIGPRIVGHDQGGPRIISITDHYRNQGHVSSFVPPNPPHIDRPEPVLREIDYSHSECVDDLKPADYFCQRCGKTLCRNCAAEYKGRCPDCQVSLVPVRRPR